MAMANISIQTDSALKEQAQAVFSALGLDWNTAISAFLRQAVREQAVPVNEDEQEAEAFRQLDAAFPPSTKAENDARILQAIADRKAGAAHFRTAQETLDGLQAIIEEAKRAHA